jgi:uncharacterized protein YdeI (YjbR/CyaY-like superfamily)
MSNASLQVDGYLRKNKKWQSVLQKLRALLHDSPLTEDVKWRAPCYTFEGGNVIMLGAFKECCVISFVKGALLKDPQGVLVKPGEQTQSVRVIRFTDADQVDLLEPTLKAYIREAIAVEKSGARVELQKITERPVPDELQKRFEESPALKTAFNALTPGRQRAYLLHFSSAKQSATRDSRIDKCTPKILAGKGIDE